MERSFRYALILLVGIALLAAAAAIHSLLIDPLVWSSLFAAAGVLLIGWGAYALRADLGAIARRRRGEIALYTLGVVGVLVAIAWFSVRFPIRVDMTTAGLFSLSPQTEQMLQRLDKPVQITFFHDPMMRETVELYQLMASHSNGKVTVELFDPMLNPAQARMSGVEFAGTAIMQSEGRRIQVSGASETDIANGILRVSQGLQQKACFLDGHGEPDPFSLESHDHMEGGAGHSHGLGEQFVLHERHGIAKARHSLETLNYTVEKVSLLQAQTDLSRCTTLIVAGPRMTLLPAEVKAIDAYLAAGGNALFMLDPFIKTGLEPLLNEFGIVAEENLIIDEASHFWTDISAPAVTDYNRHEITTDLPLTFFPGVRSFSPTPRPVPGVNVRPLVNTSKESYATTNSQRAEFQPGKDTRGPRTIMLAANRRPQAVATAEVLLRELQGKPPLSKEQDEERKNMKPSRVVVIGDSDFATNSFLNIMGNGRLFLNTVNYLSARENLIGIEPRNYDVPRVNLTNQQLKATVFLSVILIPALLALIGTGVWWRQR